MISGALSRDSRPEIGSHANVLSALREGEALGPFLLERKIAVGGMAEVWSAIKPDDREHRKYAVKVLLESLSKDRALRTMFADEVRIAQRLRHPNIVRVEGELEDRGMLFLAMELIDGKDLRRLLAETVKNRGTLPLALGAVIARETARGLGYAHAARGEDGEPLLIVHRDVSPHNIMIDRNGAVRVLDFGVARARERITRTAAGVIKGKISYMSPEQMMAGDVTAQSDIFSLGIVLWEMLALRRLFGMASDAEVISAVCEAKAPPIRSVNPNVPPELAELSSQMLKLHPKERPDSMRTVENRLARILSTCFGEEESSQEALAAWIAPHLDQPRRKTAVMPGRSAPPTRATEALQSMAPTVGIVVPPIEDATAAPTEALEIGESFADALRDDPTFTQSAGIDLSDTRPDPAAEALWKTQPYSADKQAELADTMALHDGDPPEDVNTPLALPKLSGDPTLQDLAPPGEDPTEKPLKRVVPPPSKSADRPKNELPPLPKAAPLPAPPLPQRRDVPSEIHRAMARAEEPRSARFAWVVGGFILVIGGLFLLARACGF